MIPQQPKAVFYHPLDDAVESLRSEAWSGAAATGPGRVSGAGGNGLSLSGGPGYPTAVGAARLAFATWIREPAVQTTTAPPTTTVPPTTTPAMSPQEAWDAVDPALLAAAVWEDPLGVQTGYSNWDAPMQSALRDAFDRAWLGQPSPLPDPVPNQATNTAEDDTYASQYVSQADAASLFTEYAANTLAVEVGGRVPWSVAGYPAAQLATLLDSRAMFYWDPAASNYRIRLASGADATGWSVPATADHAWSFMQGKVGATRAETVGNLLEWLRAAVHFSGSLKYGNCDDHWQYRGYVPAIRVIEGTTKTSTGTHRSYTAGCHGTYAFLRSVLRAVNIPVWQYYNGHSLPRFPTEDAYMTHGDDPYNSYCRYEDYPGEALLVPAATFATWFPNPGDEHYNVGRQVRVNAIEFVGIRLLQDYCADIGAGLSHADGSVAAYLKYWSVPELEAMGLWDDMDAKLAATGGCP